MYGNVYSFFILATRRILKTKITNGLFKIFTLCNQDFKTEIKLQILKVIVLIL